MAEQFKSVQTRLAPKINVVSKIVTKIGAQEVAAAFNAKAAGSTDGMDLLSVRESMTRLLVSSGGRPSIEGSTTQVKIPRIEADWIKLDKIAKAASSLRPRPSITQTAALILHAALSRLSEEELEEEVRKAFVSEQELLNSFG